MLETVCVCVCIFVVYVHTGSSLWQYTPSDAVLQSSEESFPLRVRGDELGGTGGNKEGGVQPL